MGKGYTEGAALFEFDGASADPSRQGRAGGNSMAVILAIAGFVAVVVSFTTWARPAVLGFTGNTDHWRTARGVLFGLWTLALPAYSLWEWYYLPHPDNIPAYAYQHKVWSDVWAAVAVVLGVLFGVKK
jgi:hypothetical protein